MLINSQCAQLNNNWQVPREKNRPYLSSAGRLWNLGPEKITVKKQKTHLPFPRSPLAFLGIKGKETAGSCERQGAHRTPNSFSFSLVLEVSLQSTVVAQARFPWFGPQIYIFSKYTCHSHHLLNLPNSTFYFSICPNHFYVSWEVLRELGY